MLLQDMVLSKSSFTEYLHRCTNLAYSCKVFVPLVPDSFSINQIKSYLEKNFRRRKYSSRISESARKGSGLRGRPSGGNQLIVFAQCAKVRVAGRGRGERPGRAARPASRARCARPPSSRAVAHRRGAATRSAARE